ncbi:MAG TPA: hypothetical protein DEP48_05255 [Persephonella sp.]|uniref:Peptidase, M48 family n=1 Tax=Persephonella marina (strain DSM 14350 / EX-H1) TaxID=123214 RepID=C0QPP2_PERMH|nr:MULTISPECIES: M48 family metalloprotease [Persephonella]ACO04576.1 peptidase, M48 family [Persephonella marina EX-H1]HCB69747.1 hypothetical protein [Persephonella sp.]
MKKSDLIFVIFLSVVGLYFYYYYFLITTAPTWIIDLKNCFIEMDFLPFLENHLNIFLYLSLLVISSFLIVKTIFSLFRSIFGYFKLNSYINRNLYKRFKNLYIINSDQIVAFNTGFFKRKIVISKQILDIFSKDEKKTVFLHEKGHLKNGDSYKLFIFSVLVNLFPKKLADKLLKDFSLLKEIEADMFCVSDRKKVELANTVLRFYTYRTGVSVPMMNSYLSQRIQFLLGHLSYEDFKVERVYLSFSLLLTVFILFSYVFNYCLCSMH